MGRVERRMYRRMRGQAAMRRLMLFLTAVVVLAGLASHLTGRQSVRVEGVTPPTPTPVTAAFDETVNTREITLPAGAWYAIQTGVYSTRDAAQGRVDAYAERGAPGYLTEDGGKWRVFIAVYEEKEDADAVRERLSSNQNVETYVHAWACPSVTLRLSGMTGQLDVAEAGLSLAWQTANQLRDAALALDLGELTVQEAKKVTQDIGDRVALWARTARERFALPCPKVVETVLAFCDDWPARESAILQSDGATVLAGRLKLQAMACYDEAIALREGLTD